MKSSHLFLAIFFGLFGLNLEAENVSKQPYEVSINDKYFSIESIDYFDVPIHTVQKINQTDKMNRIVVTAPELIQKYQVSPRSKISKILVEGNKLSFNAQKSGYFVVKINDLEYLFVLIERGTIPVSLRSIRYIQDFGVEPNSSMSQTEKIQQAIDRASKLRNAVLYFPKGTYLSGQLNFKSNTHLYLEQGAVLKATLQPKDFKESFLRMDNVENISISGYGTIDGSGWNGLRKNGATGLYLIFMSKAKNVNVNGITLKDPCFWNTRVFQSSNVHLTNIKVYNNRPLLNFCNTDGIDFDSSENCSVENGILHTGDDNVVVKGLDNSGLYNTSNLLFKNIIGISNSAAAKIGTETLVKKIDDIRFENMDVVQCKRCLVIDGFDTSDIRNVYFKNFTVENVVKEGMETPRVIDFEITNRSWRPCLGQCKISNVEVTNLNILTDVKTIQSQMVGQSEEFGIQNIRLRNIKVNGKLIGTLQDANIQTNSFVSRIKISK